MKIDFGTIKEYIGSIAIAIIAALLIQNFLFTITLVDGSSMSPSFEDKDRVFVTKLYNKKNPENYYRGDIIIFTPENRDVNFIKRVIGIPGDKIDIIDGKVIVNGKVIEEPYASDELTAEGIFSGNSIELGEDEVFVMGDNRELGGSLDSRALGPIKLERVSGKVKLRVYPFNKIESYSSKEAVE